MHTNALVAMSEMLERVPKWAKTVLDVGSADVNGTYKPMIEALGYSYIGLDIAEGKNVDIVAPPYCYPFQDGLFDIVISGSCMEHVERPWLWIPEITRVLKSGGLLAIVTHHNFPFHEHPVDCFRYYPRAFECLFDDTHQLKDYEIRMHSHEDIIGSAIKI